MLVDRDVLFKRRKYPIREMPLPDRTPLAQQTLQLLLFIFKIDVVLRRFYSLRRHSRDNPGPGEVERVCGRFQRGLRAKGRRVQAKMRDHGRGGRSGVQQRVCEFEGELSRTDKIGLGPQFGMKKIHAPVLAPNEGASKRSRLLALGRRGDVLELRSETPRRESTWVPRYKGQFDGLGSIETRTLDVSASQGGQRDWDDDLWLFHPIYI